MKKQLLIIGLVVVLLASFLNFGCSDKDEEGTYTFVLSNMFPQDSPQTVRLDEAIAQIKERTNGQVIIEDHPGGELVGTTETLEALQNGTIDMAFTGQAYCAGYPSSIVGYLTVPFNYKTLSDVGELYYHQGLDDVWRSAALEEAEIAQLGLLPSEGGIIAMKPGEDVRSLSDLDGKKMRSAPGFISALLKGEGATVVPNISTSETYSALQTGLVDGTCTTWYSMDVYGLGDLIVSVLGNYIYFMGAPIAANVDKWNKVPVETQNIVYDTLEEVFFEQAENMANEDITTRDEMVSKYGIDVYYLSETELESYITNEKPALLSTYISSGGAAAQETINIINNYYNY